MIKFRQQLQKGNTMPIPTTRADWPAAYNDIAKLIGRHWTKGKLKLNQSREASAILFDYHSSHDVKQEIVESLPTSSYPVDDFIYAITLKVLVKYQIHLDILSFLA